MRTQVVHPIPHSQEVSRMPTFRTARNLSLPFAAAGLLSFLLLAGRPALAAGPTAQPPYQLSIFAQSANGYSQPDSIVQWRDSVIVGFRTSMATSSIASTAAPSAGSRA